MGIVVELEKKKRGRPWPEQDPNLISVVDFVDHRCAGDSFDQLAGRYSVTKSILYGFYKKFKERNFDGYDPYDKARVKMLLNKKELTIPEIAQRMGMCYKGMRNYLEDHDLDRVPKKEDILKMVNEDKRSLAWIGRYYGQSYPTFKTLLKKLELDYLLSP